jgi:hypothetical protein
MPGPNPTRGFVAGESLVNSEGRFDPPRVADFLGHVLDELSKDPETADLVPAEVRKLVQDLPRCSTGQMASSFRVDGGGRLTLDTVMTVSDEKACLGLTEKGVSAVMDPTGFAKRMYQDLGLSLETSLEKVVRSHSGVPISRLRRKMTSLQAAATASGSGAKVAKPAPGAPLPRPFQGPLFAGMLRDTEFAFSHGYYLSSQDPARLDALIDRVASGPPTLTEAGPEILPGANLAVSYDFAGLMKLVGSSMPDPAAQSIVSNLPPSDPVRFAMRLSDGRLEGRWEMPLSTFGALFRAGMQAGMAARQAASPRPPLAKH